MNKMLSNEMDEETLKQYTDLKNEAVNYLLQKAFYHAIDTLRKAEALYNNDAELYSMMGDCFYEISDFMKAIECYKHEYEIDRRMFYNNFIVGRILLEKGKYSDAIGYFKEYIFQADENKDNSNKAKALRHLGYCYYFMDDYKDASYYFNESFAFASGNIYARKFLRDIKARSEGKMKNKMYKYEEVNKFHNYENYRTYINYDDYFDNCKKYSNCNVYIKENNKSIRRKRSIKSVIGFALSALLVGGLIFSFIGNELKNISGRHYSSQNVITSEGQYTGTRYKKPVSMTVTNLQPTNYYELSSKFKGEILYSKSEISENKMWSTVQCRLYTGDFCGKRVIFSIPMHECAEAEKKGRYTVSGAKYELNTNIRNDIKKNEHGHAGCIWMPGGGYVTSQKDMVDEANGIKKPSYNSDDYYDDDYGEDVTIIESAEEFKKNNYSEVQSVYLTDIVPIDYYEYYESENNVSFLTLNEMKKRGIDISSCSQMYAGKLDDLEIAFIDPKFEFLKVDDKGGYKLVGRRYMMDVDYVTVNEFKNNGKSKLDIYWWFIECSKS